MKRTAFIICLFSILISCNHKSGSGNIISENRSIGSFNGLNISGGFAVEVKKGAGGNVKLEADDNLIKDIEVKVVDNELQISLNNTNVSKAHLKVFVTAPEIKSIKASAAAQVLVKDELKSFDPIDLSVSSGAAISTSVDAPEIKAGASSGGEITLSGRTKDLRATSSSGSSIIARDLLSENSFVNVSSGANAHVNASMNIEANASSGGNILYKGAATSVKKSESSGGDIEKEN